MTSTFKKALLAGTALVAMSAVQAQAAPLGPQPAGTGTVVIDAGPILIDHDPSATTAIDFQGDSVAVIDSGVNITGNVIVTGGEGYGGLSFLGSSTVTGDVGKMDEDAGTTYIGYINTYSGTVTFQKSVTALHAQIGGDTVFNGDVLMESMTFGGEGYGEVTFNGDAMLQDINFNNTNGTINVGDGVTLTANISSGGEGDQGSLNVLGSATINGAVGDEYGINWVNAGADGATVDFNGVVTTRSMGLYGGGTVNFNDNVDVFDGIYVDGDGDFNFNGTTDADYIVAYGPANITFNDTLNANTVVFVDDATININSGGEGWGDVISPNGETGAGVGTLNFNPGDETSFGWDGTIGAEGTLKAINFNGTNNEFYISGDLIAADTTNLNANFVDVNDYFIVHDGQTIKTTVTGVDGSDLIAGHVSAYGAYIDDGAKVNITLATLDDIEVGDTLEIAHSTGDYYSVGELSALNITGSPFITWTQIADDANLILEVASIKTMEEVATGANNLAVAGAISTACSAPSAACNTFYMNLLSSPDAASFNALLESAMPTGANGSNVVSMLDAQGQALQVVEKQMIAMRDGDSASGMAAGFMPAGISLWAQGYGQAAQQGIRDGIAGYKSDTTGFAMGVDTAKYAGDKNNVFGAAFNFGRTNVNSSNANTTGADIDSYGLTIYGSRELGNGAFVSGQLGYAYNDIDTYRHNAGGAGLTANANYSSDQYSAKLLAGKDYNQAHSMVLTPTAFATYSYLHTDGYSETGTGTLLNVDSDNFDVFKVGVGLQAQWKLKSSAGEKLKPSVHVNYTYNVTGDAVESTATFVGGGPVFNTTGADPARSEFNAGAGLTYTTQANFDVTGIYDYTFKQDYASHAGLLRGTVHF